VKRTYLSFLLLLAISISCSGCVSEEGDLSEDWNSLVESANQNLEDGNVQNSKIVDALADQELEEAESLIDDASESYAIALYDIGKLMEHTSGEKFLEDYVRAWQGQVGEILNGLEYMRIMVNIDIFNVEFYKITALHPNAQLQLTQAFGHYNEGEFSAAINSADASRNKYATIGEVSSALIPVAEGIGEPYVIEYVNNIYALSTTALSCLDDIIAASQHSLEGNLEEAVDSIESAGSEYESYVGTLDVLINIESSHPNAFPSQEMALGGLRGTYLSMKENSDSLAEGYGIKMQEIEEEHKDFFE